MTVEEKLQTEVITTEQAVYCLQHIEDVDGDKCDDCPYVDVCSEKGIDGKIAQMAIKALEENEGLKHDLEQAKQYSDIYRESANRLREKVGVLEIEIQKAREEIEASATEADFADYNNLSCGEETSTETARCEAEDISMGVKLDDVRAIFDKYLGEGKDDKSDRNK